MNNKFVTITITVGKKMQVEWISRDINITNMVRAIPVQMHLEAYLQLHKILLPYFNHIIATNCILNVPY